MLETDFPKKLTNPGIANPVLPFATIAGNPSVPLGLTSRCPLVTYYNDETPSSKEDGAHIGILRF